MIVIRQMTKNDEWWKMKIDELIWCKDEHT